MSSTVAAINAGRHGLEAAQLRATREMKRAVRRREARVEIVLILAIFGLLVLGGCMTLASHSKKLAFDRIRVEPGQTVWGLAAAHPVAGQSTEETARVIAHANKLEDGRLTAGSVISVPAGIRLGDASNLAMR